MHVEHTGTIVKLKNLLQVLESADEAGKNILSALAELKETATPRDTGTVVKKKRAKNE
jgi:hypothetical protein